MKRKGKIQLTYADKKNRRTICPEVRLHNSNPNIQIMEASLKSVRRANQIFQPTVSNQIAIKPHSVHSDGEIWRQGTSTCQVFLKQYICKHIVGIAILRNYFQVSAEAKTVPLGQKRKRGRPAATKKALIVQ